MIILSAQDLEDYGVRRTAATLTFMGKAFVRGQTFAQRLRDKAIELAEESMKTGSACLLIDFDTHVTLWRENVPRLEDRTQSYVRSLQQLQVKQLQERQPQTSTQSESTSSYLTISNDTVVEPQNLEGVIGTSNISCRASVAVNPTQQQEDSTQLRTLKYRGQDIEVPGVPKQAMTMQKTKKEKAKKQSKPKKHQIRYRGRLISAD